MVLPGQSIVTVTDEAVFLDILKKFWCFLGKDFCLVAMLSLCDSASDRLSSEVSYDILSIFMLYSLFLVIVNVWLHSEISFNTHTHTHSHSHAWAHTYPHSHLFSLGVPVHSSWPPGISLTPQFLDFFSSSIMTYYILLDLWIPWCHCLSGFTHSDLS